MTTGTAVPVEPKLLSYCLSRRRARPSKFFRHGPARSRSPSLLLGVVAEGIVPSPSRKDPQLALLLRVCCQALLQGSVILLLGWLLNMLTGSQNRIGIPATKQFICTMKKLERLTIAVVIWPKRFMACGGLDQALMWDKFNAFHPG